MLKKIGVALLLLVPFGLQAEGGKEAYEYQPNKLVEEKAKNNCISLAYMNLPSDYAINLTVNTRAKVLGTSKSGKKVIAVFYPYRTDGVMFSCMFYDYTNGLLQLIEFGHAGNNTDDITSVKLLY